MKVTVTDTTFGNKYRCLVTDTKSGKVTSKVLTISKPFEAVAFWPDTPYEDITAPMPAADGDHVEMRVSGRGLVSPTYAWQVSTDKGATWTNLEDKTELGTVVVEGSNRYYMEIMVEWDGSSFANQYRCLITSGGKTAPSNVLTIKQVYTAKITASPAAVGAGKKVTLTVVIDKNEFGYVAEGYEWYVSDDKGKTWTYMYEFDPTLSVTFSENEIASIYANRRYRCELSAYAPDANHSTEEPAKIFSSAISFKQPYTITVTPNPKDQKAAVGKTVKFTASADGLKSAKYQWFESRDKGKTWKVMEGKTSKTLSVKVPEKDFDYDTFRYRVRITDKNYGIVFSDGKACIKRPFSIKLNKTSATLAAGKTTKFTVTVSGTATYEWQYSTNGGGTWTVAKKDTGYKTKTITLTGDDAHYQRLYRCKVTVKKVVSYSELIYVDPDTAKDYTFKVNEKTCEVTGYKGTGTTVKIPVGYHGRKVSGIAANAFKGKGIKKVELPKCVTSIGNYAFDGCASLTTVTLYNTVKKIGKGAFRNCVKLTTMNSKD